MCLCKHSLLLPAILLKTHWPPSSQAVGLNYRLVEKLVDIFGWDIDFAMDVRANDQFRIVYEKKYKDGKLVELGDILVAEFINKGKTYRAVRYIDPDGRTSYYNPQGRNLAQAFIRTPVKFTRISSKFNLKRRHPILHKIRAHKGVDYAAPTGTPVKATGNATVEFVGRKGGYGKVVILKHRKNYTTLYAHLSRFGKIKKGQQVRQGQVIGFVGQTGLASGPHLHYEFRINGKHRDPLKVKLPKGNPIVKKYKQDFSQHSQKMLALLKYPNRHNLISADVPFNIAMLDYDDKSIN